MKLFYILLLTILMSLFNVGCGNGDDDVPAGTPENPKPGEDVNVVTSILSKKGVIVKSGGLSAELTPGANGCIKLTPEQWATVEISTTEGTVLCGGEGNAACENKDLLVNRNEDNSATIISDSPYSGCSHSLEKAGDAAAGDEGAGDAAAGDEGAGDAAAGDEGAGDAAAGAQPDTENQDAAAGAQPDTENQDAAAGDGS